MTGTRVVLITASGPGGQIDIGVRADATPTDLVGSLGSVIGIGPGSSVVEHHAPPRPGMPQGRRAQLTGDASLAGSGVADGDMIIFRKPSDRSSISHRPWSVPSEPGPVTPRPARTGPGGVGPGGAGPIGPGGQPSPDPGSPRPGGSQPPVIAPAGPPRRPGAQEPTRPRLQPAPPPTGHQAARPQAPASPSSWPGPADRAYPGPGQLPPPGSGRDEHAGTDRMYRPARGDSGDPTRSSRSDSPDSEVIRPDLPSLPRVDLPHAHVTRQADDSTRPAARREPGAHRASGSGNGRSYRPGPTRGIESDEPDDRS